MNNPTFDDDHEFNDYETNWLNWAAQTMLERDWHGTARDARFLSMLAERYRLEDEADPERSAANLAKTRRQNPHRTRRRRLPDPRPRRIPNRIHRRIRRTLPVVDNVTVSELSGPLFWALSQPSDRLRDYLTITNTRSPSPTRTDRPHPRP